MSGIEIAGLVLAVLPIFIAAAEHIKADASFRRGLKDGLFADSCKVKLTQQRTLLNLYIKSVVGRTSLSPNTQAVLVDDPTSDAWDRPEVTKAIAQELGAAYHLFMELLRRVCAALAKHIEASTAGKLTEDEVVCYATAPFHGRGIDSRYSRSIDSRSSHWTLNKQQALRRRRQRCGTGSSSIGSHLKGRPF